MRSLRPTEKVCRVLNYAGTGLDFLSCISCTRTLLQVVEFSGKLVNLIYYIILHICAHKIPSHVPTIFPRIANSRPTEARPG